MPSESKANRTHEPDVLLARQRVCAAEPPSPQRGVRLRPGCRVQPAVTGGRTTSCLPVRRGLTAQRLARAAVRCVTLHVVELQQSALFQQNRTATADAPAWPSVVRQGRPAAGHGGAFITDAPLSPMPPPMAPLAQCG
jgi:hypothetical protein